MATTPSLDLGALDLGALDAPTPSPALPAGTAPRAPIGLFYEDPNQPRTEFDEPFIKELAAEIKETGSIHTAINVCPPDPDGRMKIIHGAQRYRATALAGLPDIPYLIQTDEKVFDSYSQVSENQKRRGLTPRELANFIDDRIKIKNESQAFIAKKLGLDKAEITCLLTLINGPSYVVALYDQNKCRTPKYLYELANLAKIDAKTVEEFCETSSDFTRPAIQALAASLKKPGVGNTNENPSKPGAGSAGLDKLPNEGGGAGGEDEGEGGPGKKTIIPAHNPDNEKDGAGKPGAPADPSKIKRPLLLGRFNKRDVMVMLYKRPTTPGLVFVKFEDGGGEEEVDFGLIKNLTLTEGTA